MDETRHTTGVGGGPRATAGTVVVSGPALLLAALAAALVAQVVSMQRVPAPPPPAPDRPFTIASARRGRVLLETPVGDGDSNTPPLLRRSGSSGNDRNSDTASHTNTEIQTSRNSHDSERDTTTEFKGALRVGLRAVQFEDSDVTPALPLPRLLYSDPAGAEVRPLEESESAPGGGGGAPRRVAAPVRRPLPRWNASANDTLAAELAAAVGGTLPPPPPAAERRRAAGAADAAGDGFTAGAYDDGRAYTQQTCYEDGDESELCVYDGVLCFDGTSPVAVVAHPPSLGGQPGVDAVNDCVDYRYLEPAQYEHFGCSYAHGGPRPYDPTAHPRELHHDWPLTSPSRWWGPHNRHHLWFREMAASTLFARDAVTVIDEPFQRQAIDGVRLARRTFSPAHNLTVDWLGGSGGGDAMFIATMPGQAAYNPFHYWAALAGPLYAAVRNNASGPFGASPRDGYFHDFNFSDVETADPGAMGSVIWTYRDTPTRNRVAERAGAQWPLPRLGVVIGAGDGGKEVTSAGGLGAWYAAALQLAMPPGGVPVFFNDLLSAYSNNHLLCARRAVVPSAKQKFFSAPADAWLYRQRAHLQAGLNPDAATAHPRFPPRTITVVDRAGHHGRGIWNRDWLLGELEATGLPVTVVDRMDELSFAEQVRLMAGTGLLIAAHGAHLANAMFLPQHAAVIELFPPLMYKGTYRYLSALAGLHYFSVHSRHLLPVNRSVGGAGLNVSLPRNDSSGALEVDYSAYEATPGRWRFFGELIMESAAFHRECVATNISGYEMILAPHCNWASKTLGIIVPKRQFGETLRDALDAIGAYTLLNAAWTERVGVHGEGLPLPGYDTDDGDGEGDDGDGEGEEGDGDGGEGAGAPAEGDGAATGGGEDAQQADDGATAASEEDAPAAPEWLLADGGDAAAARPPTGGSDGGAAWRARRRRGWTPSVLTGWDPQDTDIG
jgi:hypothetical protein